MMAHSKNVIFLSSFDEKSTPGVKKEKKCRYPILSALCPLKGKKEQIEPRVMDGITAGDPITAVFFQNWMHLASKYTSDDP